MMSVFYCYILTCVMWFVYNIKIRPRQLNKLEKVLTWSLFIPVTFSVLIVGLIGMFIKSCEERS